MTLRWADEIPHFSPQQVALTDRIWADRKAGMFNGKLMVFHALALQNDHIELTGVFTEYRFYYAQKRQQVDFGLMPLAVSGVIVCEDQLIFARRSANVTDYPNWYELVPSGSLDGEMRREDGTVDYLEQLRREFTEETTLPVTAIQALRPLGLIKDTVEGVYDIACKIHLNVSQAELMRGLERSGEYDAPTAVPLAQVEEWLNTHQVIPTTQGILALYKNHV